MMPGPPKPWLQPETQYISVRNVVWASGKGPFLPWGRAQGAQGGTGGHTGGTLGGHFWGLLRGSCPTPTLNTTRNTIYYFTVG
jgi:hypothetical protein